MGKYPRNHGDNGCKRCNTGTYVSKGGGNNALSCQVCPVGTNKTRYANYRACFCLDNYFRRHRFGSCDLCPNPGLVCAHDYVTIKPQYYWNWTCCDSDRYENFKANLQVFNDSYDDRTTSYDGPLPYVHQCPQSFKCANNESKLEGNCARGYTGWLCSTCAKGYFSVFGFCRSCPKSIWALLAEVVAIIVVIGCFVGFVAYTYSREVNDGRRSIVDVVLARGKIVIGFYQVMGEFWESLNGVYWQTIFKTLSQWLDILQLNVSNVVIKPSCFFPNFRLTPYVEFIIGVSTPVIILALSITILLAKRIYSLLKNRKGRSNFEQSETTHTRDKVFLLSLLALYITYPSTCNSIFALYRPVCQTFYLDENKEMTVALLRPEFSINCSTEVHRRYEISAYVMSSYVVAFPGILLYLLWKFSEGKLYPNHAAPGGKHSYPKWLRFLSENYKGQFWFWEIIELCRRVSQTFVVILFGWASSLSIVITLLLAVIFLSLHISYSPIADKFEHHLQVSKHHLFLEGK